MVLVETHTLVIEHVQVRVQAVELVGLQQAVAAVTERVAATLSDEELHLRLKAVDDLRRNLATNVREVLALEVGFLHAFG